MDSVVGNVPADGPVVIITASFEGEPFFGGWSRISAHSCSGQPADNAAHFVEWLSSLSGSELEKVSFAVFGCGNHDWVSTYQRIPTLCDDLLSKRGAKRLLDRGAGDAGSGDFFETFDHWEINFWSILDKVRLIRSRRYPHLTIPRWLGIWDDRRRED